MNGSRGISYEIALRWMPLNLSDEKSTLVQVMAWCRQATSHYLNQCWPRSPTPYGVIRPQWVNIIHNHCLHLHNSSHQHPVMNMTTLHGNLLYEYDSYRPLLSSHVLLLIVKKWELVFKRNIFYYHICIHIHTLKLGDIYRRQRIVWSLL